MIPLHDDVICREHLNSHIVMSHRCSHAFNVMGMEIAVYESYGMHLPHYEKICFTFTAKNLIPPPTSSGEVTTGSKASTTRSGGENPWNT